MGGLGEESSVLSFTGNLLDGTHRRLHLCIILAMEWYTSEIGGEVRSNDDDPDLERPVATGKYRLASHQVLSHL